MEDRFLKVEVYLPIQGAGKEDVDEIMASVGRVGFSTSLTLSSLESRYYASHVHFEEVKEIPKEYHA